MCGFEAEWALDYYWVWPERISCGVGNAVMQHAKELIWRSKAETMTVISDPNAEGFYLKKGFEKVGMHPSKPNGRIPPVLSLRKEWL